MNQRFLIIMLVIPLVVLTGCLRYEGEPDGRRVAVVGDSIVAQATTPLKEELAADGWRYNVGARYRITIAEAREPYVLPAIASKPDAMVVELGTNDAIFGWYLDDAPTLDRILKDLDAVPCVVWVVPDALDPPPTWWDNIPADGTTLRERIQRFQASLERRLPRHPNVHIADWGAVAAPGDYELDKLHPSPAGEQHLATYIREQLDLACPRARPRPDPKPPAPGRRPAPG